MKLTITGQSLIQWCL